MSVHVLHKATEILRSTFGHQEFRNGQLEIIDSIISCNDTLAVMPTGGGKSLCYQIPALVLEGTAIVISPLIALMKDQVDALTRQKISATFINSSLPFGEIQQRMTNARFGAYKLLYIAPERLSNLQFLEQLKTIQCSFLAIDEAHCISEWGHDFRPAYTVIPSIFEHIRRVPIIALTATATTDVQADIVRALALESPKKFIRGFDRPNLRYSTEECSDKAARACEILKHRLRTGSAIIYCGSRKRVEETASTLTKYGVPSSYYHAGLSEHQRSQTQDSFINGDVQVLVATSAFGMGVDKANVRYVFHFDIPQTLEAYYQEAGRAGRDGKNSECIMLYHKSDRKLQDFFISSTYPDKQTIQTIYTFLYDSLGVARGVKPQTPLYLDDIAIAHRVNLSTIVVSNTLSLFERMGILRRGATHGLATIHIISDRHRLVEYFNTTTPERKIVLETLLRGISSSALQNKVSVNINKLTSKYDVPYDQFVSAMRAFEYARLIRYEPPASSGGLTILLERMALSSIPIDFNGLEQRRELAIKKLDIVERYATTHSCKRNFILSYFQDDTPSENCHRCSSCMQPEVKPRIPSEQKQQYVLLETLRCIAELNGRFGKNVLASILAGNTPTKVKLYGLEKAQSFARLSEYSRTDIVDSIDNIITNRYAYLSSSQYPTVMITPTGLTLLGSNKPKVFVPQYAPKVNVTKTVGDSLLHELERLRKDIASRYKCSQSLILTDKQLLEIQRTVPTTLATIAQIDGIHTTFLTRWANDFLYIIRQHSSNDTLEDSHQKRSPLSPTIRATLDLLDQGYTLFKIAEDRHLSIGTIAMHIQEAIEQGHTVSREKIVSSTLFDEIASIIRRKPRALLKEVRNELMRDDIDFAVLRVAVAFVRRDQALQETQ